MTFPHVKQRTGMIMAQGKSGRFCGIRSKRARKKREKDNNCKETKRGGRKKVRRDDGGGGGEGEGEGREHKENEKEDQRWWLLVLTRPRITRCS
jgi:hypothetical protein